MRSAAFLSSRSARYCLLYCRSSIVHVVGDTDNQLVVAGVLLAYIANTREKNPVHALDVLTHSTAWLPLVLVTLNYGKHDRYTAVRPEVPWAVTYIMKHVHRCTIRKKHGRIRHRITYLLYEIYKV